MGHRIEHHPEAEGDHGKINFIPPDTQVSDHQCRDGSGECTDRKGEEERFPTVRQHQADAVSPDPEEAGLSEGEQTGIAEKEIEAHGEEAHDEDLGQNQGPVDRQQERADDQDDGHRQTPDQEF